MKEELKEMLEEQSDRTRDGLNGMMKSNGTNMIDDQFSSETMDTIRRVRDKVDENRKTLFDRFDNQGNQFKELNERQSKIWTAKNGLQEFIVSNSLSVMLKIFEDANKNKNNLVMKLDQCR
jgi:hypothetical protein